MNQFVHLHVHSHYSILDGQASIQSLVDKAIDQNMPGIALTDHGNMYGIKEFFNYVEKKNGKYEGAIKELKNKLKELSEEAIEERENLLRQIQETEKKLFKPIFGCEVYVARNGRLVKETKQDRGGHHLILLAKNKVGYHNLVKLVSLGWIDGFYGRPRIDKEILEQYKEGLIVCSACLGGEIPRLIQSGDLNRAKEMVLWFKSLWGEDYYIELQRHATNDPLADQRVGEIQKEVNIELVRLATECGVKIIASNDVHFVNQEDAEAHDHLICLNTGADLNDTDRMRYTKQEWLKSSEEMATIFADYPEALSNTLEIYNKVETFSINSKAIMPDFPLPEGFDNDGEYLRYLTYKGAEKRYPDISPEDKERIDFELNTILSMGFPGYFLIVQDFIQAGREMGVAVGPGRGSAAGSAVAYCLGITDIDPIKYDLLFERFLNPDRISMPDIDIDFDDDGRAKVLEYVTNKYGKDRVAHIVTFGTMATKSALKDVARVQKLPLSESDRLTKLVPDKIPDVKKVNLAAAIRYVEELQQAANSPDPVMRNTLKFAQQLEGTVRNTGVHACGIIIGKDDLSNYVPISTVEDKEQGGERMLVTQYEGSLIEDVGMLKMDFLGLKTLSIIKDAIENIEQTHGTKLDISSIPLDDPTTYQLYSDGKTTGTFQFESAGMQKYLKELQPSTFEDLIAMNALYRPGPMDYIPQFIARKHGNEPITYDIPIMERYLKDTYGITVYQEQVMLLSRLLADFTRGQSDELRKAMGKKIIEKMNALKVKFMEGAQKNGHDPKTLEKIWGDWEKFASYAFNKSHATCYSWVAYQTAYLKANYPSEYMAAVLSRSLSNITDIQKFMEECKAMKIEVLGPDINESYLAFSVNRKGNIRFGLGAIKGVGEGAVEAIVNERKANGAFSSIFDFVERVNLNACNRKNVECLVLAGAFDGFEGIKREDFFHTNNRNETFIEQLLRYGNRSQSDKAMQSNSLFGFGMEGVEVAKPELIPAPAWSDLERLNKELELVGFYISAHPLDEYYITLKFGCNTRMAELADKNQLKDRSQVTFGGLVTNFREGISAKSNKPYGIVAMEDYESSGEIPLFGDDYLRLRHQFYKGAFLYITGSIVPRRYREDEFELRIQEVVHLSDKKDSAISAINIHLPIDRIDPSLINELQVYAQENRGNVDLRFVFSNPHLHYKVKMESQTVKMNVTKDFIFFLDSNEEISYTFD